MNNINKVISSFTVLPFLFFITSCNANDTVNESLCKPSLSIEESLPELVLVGTDVVNIESFRSSKKALANNYLAEIGGATLNFSITSNSQIISAERTFQEPGEPIKNSLYKPVCIYNDTILAKDLIGKIVDDGILILEKKPNTEGVPINLWVLYNEIK